MTLKPTEKQLNLIDKIIDYNGEEKVKDYFYKHFPNGNYEEMNRKQSQKLITGLPRYVSLIRRVYGRDVF